MGNIFSSKNNIKEPGLVPILTLAYIGDAVYEIWVRNFIVQKRLGKGKVQQLHGESVSLVQAHTQAALAHELLSRKILKSDEESILKRGRNKNNNSAPKNANIGEYRLATGLEALVGYLYLKRAQDRLDVVFDVLAEFCDEKHKLCEKRS